MAQATPVILALALLSVTFAAFVPIAESAGGARVVAFGDVGVTSNARANVDAAVAEGAQGYVGLGDYYYWAKPSDWESMMAPLLSRGAHMALGNHDDVSVLSKWFPDGSTWSRNVGGARLVGIDTTKSMAPGSSQYTRVRSMLCSAAEPMRIVAMHHNWWLGSGAHHPGSEFPASASDMDRLVTDCGVDLVLAGHEHNYQRLARNGVPYVIVGTGGQSLYGVAGAPGGTVASTSQYGRLVLDLRADGFSAEFRTLGGATFDRFASTAAATPAPTGSAVTFSPGGGNSWWVQTKVSGASVASVEARAGDGAWRALTLRSWGAWAASFYVAPGATVTYRATLGDGMTVTSCAYEHPNATCAGYTATFGNVRGNEWWVEADVEAAGLAGVEARVDGGAWVPLEKRSWGSWAKSMRAPAGSSVELRARSADGQLASSPAYPWPPR